MKQINSILALAGFAASSVFVQVPAKAQASSGVQEKPSPMVTRTAAPLPAAAPVASQPMMLNPTANFGKLMEATPHLAFNSVNNHVVRDIHMKPLYATAIILPKPVEQIIVGTSTLFGVEHNDSDPYLLSVKPTTHDPAESNLTIAMVGGDVLSLRLISSGDAPSPVPIDFVVDFRGRPSLFDQTGLVSEGAAVAASQAGPTVAAPPDSGDSSDPIPGMNTDTALQKEYGVGAPSWISPRDLSKMIKANALAPNVFAIAVGDIRQEGGNMVVSFSVLNTSDHWIQMMPPQVELTNPLISKRQAKKKGKFAQPVISTDYKLAHPKLAPGERCDGSVTFPKPDSKVAKEALMLHLATSASIDTPMYYPLPFVAPSTAELIERENPNGN